LKPIIKLDNAGIGYKENEYDRLPLIFMNTTELHKQKTISKDDQHKTTNTYKNLQQEAYQKFQNTSILQDGNLIQNPSKISDKEESVNSIRIPIIDEALFKACGHRTTHQTARYGHRLSGKLARIALQDELFLKANTTKMSQTYINPAIAETKMLYRKMKGYDTEQENDSDGNVSQSETEVPIVQPKTKKKKNRRKMNNLSQQLSSCNIQDNDTKSISRFLQKDKNVFKKENKQSEEDSSLTKKDKISNSTFYLQEGITQHTNIQDAIQSPGGSALVISEEDKHKLHNKKKQSAAQECIIFVDLSKKVNDEMKLVNRKMKTKRCIRKMSWYSLSKNDIAKNDNKVWNKQKIDIDDEQKIDPNCGKKIDLDCEQKNMSTDIKKLLLEYVHLSENNTVHKLDTMVKYCFKMTNACENIAETSSKQLTLPDKQLTNIKKLKNSSYLKEIAETAIRLNFRIQRKKKQRHRTRQKKQVETVIHKLKDKVFSHDINALIKDLTTINIAEKVNTNKKNLTQTHLTPV
jgi:hypothetical protein